MPANCPVREPEPVGNLSRDNPLLSEPQDSPPLALCPLLERLPAFRYRCARTCRDDGIPIRDSLTLGFGRIPRYVCIFLRITMRVCEGRPAVSEEKDEAPLPEHEASVCLALEDE